MAPPRGGSPKISSLKKSRSKVSFDETATKTIVVKNPAKEPQDASWYTLDELSQFRNTGSPEARSSIRKDFVRALLTVQKEHQELGIHDPKGLRQQSRACSRDSIKKAIERAHTFVEELDTDMQ